MYLHTSVYYICICRSLGVVSDKIASAKRNSVQTGNPPPTTTTNTTTNNNNDNNNGRCEGEGQGTTRVLGSFLAIYMDKNRNGAGGFGGFRCPVSGVRWAAIDGTVRGPREI